MPRPRADKGASANSQFNPRDRTAYKVWREKKLRRSLEHPLEAIDVENLRMLSAQELQKISASISTRNLAIFNTGQDSTKGDIVELGKQLGLSRLDGNLCSDEDNISSITVARAKGKGTYIPYSNKPIGWHTDGYYNKIPKQSIHSFILYCVSNALKGGSNRVIDHELAYIHLRDLDPRYVEALSHPKALTIPPNEQEGKIIRPEQTGPVFSTLGCSQFLHMRYTIRQRNVIWREDPILHEATHALKEFLNSDDSRIFDLTLQPGQGILSNNVLHMRTSFEDASNNSQKRLLYRARYFDRITLNRGASNLCSTSATY
ncbi:MAG: TauD/TfdA family dioxygenase [bacterium]